MNSKRNINFETESYCKNGTYKPKMTSVESRPDINCKLVLKFLSFF